MNEYLEIEHTADIGLEIWGNKIGKLFSNAVDGYYNLVLSDNYKFELSDVFNFKDKDIALENLLISFLTEINYFLMVKKKIVNPINSLEIKEENENYSLIVSGQLRSLCDPEEIIKTEIKAVTYHQIKILEENGIYRTRVIFDI